MLSVSPIAVYAEDINELLAKMLKIELEDCECFGEEEAKAVFAKFFPEIVLLSTLLGSDEGAYRTWLVFHTQEEAAEFKLRYM